MSIPAKKKISQSLKWMAYLKVDTLPSKCSITHLSKK